MTKFDTYLLDESLEEKRRRLEEERKHLFDKVIRAIHSLRERYGIKGAYILGSLLNPKRWYPFSDVDVALSGCSPHILDIMAELEEATKKEVDIIDLDRHLYPEMVKRRGQKVYE